MTHLVTHPVTHLETHFFDVACSIPMMDKVYDKQWMMERLDDNEMACLMLGQPGYQHDDTTNNEEP